MKKEFLRSIVLTTTLASVTPIPNDQASGIVVSAGTHISSDSPRTPFVETFLAINPRNPKNLVAASMVGTEGAVVSRVYASRDGGLMWQRARSATDVNPIFKGADPTVYFDSEGTAFFSTLQTEGLGISRSTDGGFTWGDPIIVLGGHDDREFMAFDDSGGKFNGRIYVGAATRIIEKNGKRHLAIDIAYSTDHGVSFSPGTITTGDWQSGEYLDLSDPLVTPEGKLVVPFESYSYPPLPGPSHASQLWTMVSQDGGHTFSPALPGPSVTTAEGFQMLKSFSFPRAAIDLSSGVHRGRIYITWANYNSKRYAIAIAHSDDLGMTWAPPVVVNDNQSEGDPANPAIAVNKDGVVGVTFNDRRDDPNNSCFRLYFAASLDGGETFLPNTKASDNLTCPMAPGNWALETSSYRVGNRVEFAILSVAGRWPNGGDTQGLVATPDGVFHSAWINGESGVMQLWLKEIKVDTTKMMQSPFATHREYLGGDLSLELTRPEINFATHIVSVRARLANRSAIAIPGPFLLVLDDMDDSTLKNLQVMNADNGVLARGASWSFTIGGKGSLGPQEKSDERIIQWAFKGNLPEDNHVPVGAHFIILGGSAQ